jgi:hypothetical protein
MRQLRQPGHLRQLLGRGKKHECSSRAEKCPDCLSTLHRERQYLERLRSAAVPDAPDDLTARLLARTEELARTRPEPTQRLSPPMKVVGLAAAGAATTAGALGLAAFMMAGDPAPLASATAGPASAAGASLDGGAAYGGASVEAFRSQGWLCPELSGLGLPVVAIGTTVVSGEPALELRLSDGEHYARIIEQHPDLTGTLTASPQELPGPVNVLTGHSAAEDGFSPVEQPEGLPGASLWVNRATPWTAIYEAPGTMFTYVSDLPPERADDALIALAAAAAGSGKPLTEGSAQEAAGGPAGSAQGDAATGSAREDGDSLVDRFQRGLRRIFGPLIP